MHDVAQLVSLSASRRHAGTSSLSPHQSVHLLLQPSRALAQAAHLPYAHWCPAEQAQQAFGSPCLHWQPPGSQPRAACAAPRHRWRPHRQLLWQLPEQASGTAWPAAGRPGAGPAPARACPAEPAPAAASCAASAPAHTAGIKLYLLCFWRKGSTLASVLERTSQAQASANFAFLRLQLLCDMLACRSLSTCFPAPNRQLSCAEEGHILLICGGLGPILSCEFAAAPGRYSASMWGLSE